MNETLLIRRSQNEHDSLVERIYDTVQFPGTWAEVLASVVAHCDADHGRIAVYDAGETTFQFSIDTVQHAPQTIKNYLTHYQSIDPRRNGLAMRTGNLVFKCHDQFDDRFVSRSEFYQDFLLPLGQRYAIGTRLDLEGGIHAYLWLSRAPQSRRFEDHQQQRLQDLTGHFRRALDLQMKMQSVSQQGRLTESVLSRLNVATLVVDDQGRLLYSNKLGLGADSDSPLAVDNQGRLRLRNLGEQPTFELKLRQVLLGGARTGMMLRKGREDSGFILFSHLGYSSKGSLHGPQALLTVTRFKGQYDIPSDLLNALFSLSPGEVLLAQALTRGETPVSYATRRGLGISTVRSQLRRVLRKTGAQRQTDLISLLGQMLPLVENLRSSCSPELSQNFTQDSSSEGRVRK